MEKERKKWEPEGFRLETGTVWSFPDRGSWATHDASYRGNWSPYIPRNLILRYSKEGELVLDQFVGGGTTLIEAKLLKRNIIGVDVNDKSLKWCKEKTSFFQSENDGKVYIHKGDARNLDFIPDNSIDFICTHPPYADIIHYSQDIDNDLSLLGVSDFLKAMQEVAGEAYRVLKEGKYCAFLIGDTRIKGKITPLGFELMKVFNEQGFKLKEVIIKEQHNCRMTLKWEQISKERNFMLIAHEYIFVMIK